MRLDDDQRKAVSVSTNAVVSAGAGSGKTSVLTQRYLRLVADEHIPVHRILALTFTRKAAAEMYRRVYEALQGRGDDPFVQEQLSSFDKATVATLDSFCAGVARNGCAAYGIPPTFAVDEVRMRELADRLALSFLLERAEQPPIAAAIRLNRFVPFWRAGLATLAVDHFLVAGDQPPTGYLERQWQALLQQLPRLVDQVAGIVTEIQALDPGSARCIASGQAVIAAQDLDDLFSGRLIGQVVDAGWGGRSGEPARESQETATRISAAIGSCNAVARVNLQCGGSRSPEVAVYKELVKSLRDAVPHLTEALETATLWPEIRELCDRLDEFREIVVRAKRTSGLLSYRDVTALAIAILSENIGLRRYYKRRFSAIMIDEFQDNNQEQKQLLYLLAESPDADSPGVPSSSGLDPAKLFFVGDEKQSIYRFRGADVSVFRSLAGELTGELGVEGSIRLGYNYRSEPGLIAFFNELFSRVFQDARESYEARFEPLKARAPSPGVTPRVEYWRVGRRLDQTDRDAGELLEDGDAEAFHIARFISETVAAGSLPLPGGRAADHSDFAILMRSSSNQIRVERMLRLFGVPYVSQSVRSLFLEAPVNDLYQALQLVVYPGDRVAYAGFLRSPLAGLSDDGIVRVLSACESPFASAADDGAPDGGGDLPGDNDPQLSQSASGRALLEGMRDEDRRRYREAARRYRELLTLADSVPITELLHTIWYRWGYRYHLLRRPEYTTYLEYYDFFWELAAGFEERGLAAFLDEVRTHIGQNEKLDELEVIRGEGGGVQIMTIHKAKGLEFPVVIVANAGNRGQNDSVSASPFYWSPQWGPAFNVGRVHPGEVKEKAVNYFYRMERDAHEARELAERKRLLYVAATRAECHLVFSGIERDDERSLTGILGGPFQAAATVLEDAEDLSVVIRELPPVTMEEESNARLGSHVTDMAVVAGRYAALPAAGRRFRARETTVSAVNAAVQRLSQPAAGVQPSPVETSGEAVGAAPLLVDALLDAHPGLATVFGTYCHFCVEYLGKRWDGGRGGPPALARVPGSARPPLDGADLDTFLKEGFDLARRFMESSPWRSLSAGGEPEYELPFLLRWDDEPAVVIRGTIDLVVALPDRVHVIDFKSDRMLLPEHYHAQLHLYRNAAEALFGKPAVTSLYSLRSASLTDVDPHVTPDILREAVNLATDGDSLFDTAAGGSILTPSEYYEVSR